MLPGARGPGDHGLRPARRRHAAAPASTARWRRCRTTSLKFTALVGIAEGDAGCTLDDINACATVRGLLVAHRLAAPRAPRRRQRPLRPADFLWHGGGEARLFYPKRNILGFSFDFAEDVTKTNWGVELTWVDDVDLPEQHLAQPAPGERRLQPDGLRRPADLRQLPEREPHVLLQRAALRPLPAPLRRALRHRRPAHRARHVRDHDRLPPGPPAALDRLRPRPDVGLGRRHLLDDLPVHRVVLRHDGRARLLRRAAEEPDAAQPDRAAVHAEQLHRTARASTASRRSPSATRCT